MIRAPPRSPVGIQTWIVMYPRPPCLARCSKRLKKPLSAGKQRHPPKKTNLHTDIHSLYLYTWYIYTNPAPHLKTADAGYAVDGLYDLYNLCDIHDIYMKNVIYTVYVIYVIYVMDMIYVTYVIYVI